MNRALWINRCKDIPNWAVVRVLSVQKRTARIQVRRNDGRLITRYTKLTRLQEARHAV